MDNNLTISSLDFNSVFSDKDGSLRREVSRGGSAPTDMTIKSQPYVDTETKGPGKRTVLRFDYITPGTDGQPIKGSAYLVVARPLDAAFTDSMVTNLLAYLVSVLTSPLALGDEIFIAGEQ
jgi:hypothetical protein